jgi:mRNA interferase RelE/StbE
VYQLIIERTAEKDMSRLSDEVHDRVAGAISRLAVNPRPHGAKKLAGKDAGWRIRVGDYRVLYDIAETVRIVRVFRVRHRREAYR